MIRGGYRLSYDRVGSQLAVTFDLNSDLGFFSRRTIAANTFNVSDNLGPQLTGSNPNVRAFFPAGSLGSQLRFPLTTPADQDQRIEQSLDDTLKTPYNHSVNLSYGREIGKGLSFEASYVGRFARGLLASRDIMQLNNIRDPQSGQTWYGAVNQLIDLRYANAPISSVQSLPFFQNLLPGLARTRTINGVATPLTATQEAYRRLARRSVGGGNSTDYTFLQLLWDDRRNCTDCPFPGFGGALVDNLFYHPQYAALPAFGNNAYSNYNSAQLSVRQRFGNDLTFDINYMLGHSLDNASGLQNSTAYGGAFILNALDPDASYASSDFDVRHIINANLLATVPFGRGKRFLNNLPGVANALVSGFKLTSIFRSNTGLPFGEPFASDRWATNWNVQSNMVRVRPLTSSTTAVGEPNIFSDPDAAFSSFRDARPGENGDRNILREPSYISVDLGVYRDFKIDERRTIQFRTEIYNLKPVHKSYWRAPTS